MQSQFEQNRIKLKNEMERLSDLIEAETFKNLEDQLDSSLVAIFFFLAQLASDYRVKFTEEEKSNMVDQLVEEIDLVCNLCTDYCDDPQLPEIVENLKKCSVELFDGDEKIEDLPAPAA